MKIRNAAIVCGVVCMLLLLTGCEALVKKFTRKPKKDEGAPVLVLAPEEYKSTMTKEEQYRQYFLFWKSWHDELINSLLEHKSQKKKIDCADETIKNLNGLFGLLDEPGKQKMGEYIGQATDIRGRISRDAYGHDDNFNRTNAERLKMDIMRDFSFQDIKDTLQ